MKRVFTVGPASIYSLLPLPVPFTRGEPFNGFLAIHFRHHSVDPAVQRIRQITSLVVKYSDVLRTAQPDECPEYGLVPAHTFTVPHDHRINTVGSDSLYQ